ncbi:hypothetical protein Tco_0370289 [Tanacetum coccineum]
MSMWIISRGVVLLILLMEYKVLRDFLLHRSSINNSARLSNKFGGFYFSFKFDISGLLHHVITTIAYRIRDKDTSQSKQNLQSSSMTFIHKTLIIPSVLDFCFISSTVSKDKRDVSSMSMKYWKSRLLWHSLEEKVSLSAKYRMCQKIGNGFEISYKNRNNLLSKHRDLVQTLNTCKEQLLVLKQAKLDCTTMQHASTEILKENKNLRKELNELESITKTWLNSSKQVNQCISEQIPSQNKRILGVGQLTEYPSSSGLKDLVFIKSSADNTKASIPSVERPWLSEAEGFIFPNHDTDRILLAESQRNSTDPLVAVIDSSETEYNSGDESSVCSTFFLPLEKPGDAEAVSGPKAVKTTLKSISTFKAKA